MPAPGAFEVFTGEFQNLSHRLTPTMGLGYHLFRSSSGALPASGLRVADVAGRWLSIHAHRFRATSHSKDIDDGVGVFEAQLDTDLTSWIDLIVDDQLH